MDIGHRFLDETRYRADVPEALSDQQKGLPQPPLELPPTPGVPLIALPDPHELSLPAIDLLTAINRRHSLRLYRDEPLSLDELSYLLWCTQGVKAVTPRPCTLRTVPSGGARHAFETYLMVRAVTGLEPGIYRFLAIEHSLQLVKTGSQVVRDVTELCGDQKMVELSAVTFIWTAVPYRMIWRYNQRAYRGLFLDAGHVCQNLYLACEAIGAGTCAIAAYDQDAIDRLLRVDGEDEFVVYLAPVGKIKPGGDEG